jgi:hypothetical protein
VEKERTRLLVPGDTLMDATLSSDSPRALDFCIWKKCERFRRTRGCLVIDADESRLSGNDQVNIGELFQWRALPWHTSHHSTHAGAPRQRSHVQVQYQ